MAKRSSKKKSKKQGIRARLGQFGGGLSLEALARPTIAAAWLLVIGGAVVGWMLGVPKLKAAIAEEAAALPPQPIEVVFLDAPAWVAGELRDELAWAVRDQLGSDPFDRADLVEARSALLQVGCFEEVVQVQRTADNRIEVRAVYLDPYAVVHDKGEKWLIDPLGRLLPPWFQLNDRVEFIAITGTRYDPPARPGLQWEGGDVTAALKILRLLDHQPWRSQIVEIDVTGYTDGQPLRLITDQGSRIIWGSAPGEERGLELSAQEKFGFLTGLYQRQQRIDGHHEGELYFQSEPAGIFGR